MISPLVASVSCRSSPSPTSMRTLRSPGATINMTPFVLALLSDLPGPAELIAEVLDLVTL
jgi:hypothetical protein